ncbi:MAG TPA: DMT family transporter [bacterium]|nr:DMT family transporter [bacterium]
MSDGSTGTKPPAAPFLWTSLGISVFAISAAAPLIIRAGAPAPVTSLWRMLGAGIVLFAWALVTQRPFFARLNARDLGALFVSGNLLALHYLFWIASLSRTSVVSSTVLVTTNPLWVGLGAWIFLREPPTRRTWIAVAVGIAGAVLLAVADANDAGASKESLSGDAMALAAALAGSGTMLYGRKLRASMPTVFYQGFVCLFAVPLVVATIAATHAPVAPASGEQALLLLAIMVLPQLVGNTILSWALGFLTAPRVALVILGEPIGASLLAWLFVGQTPHLAALPGSALVLAAVVLDVVQPMRDPREHDDGRPV